LQRRRKAPAGSCQTRMRRTTGMATHQG
jgi:hypothetical protein